MSAREHGQDGGTKRAAAPEPLSALDKAIQRTLAKGTRRGAYQGAALNARSQVRTAVGVAGVLMIRLVDAYEEYVAAAEQAAACKTKARKTLERVAESKRQQLAELRRTINAVGPLNATMLKAGKVVHDADLDRLLRVVEITGTKHMDEQLEGDA